MPDYSVPVPRYWRNIGTYYRLSASRCRKCGRVYYPPRARCTCGSTDMEKIDLVKVCQDFKLLDFTVLHSVSIDFEKQKPLVFGLVRCPELDIVVLTQLTDVLNVDELHPGAAMEPVFRVVKRDGQYGIVCYGTKFRISSGEVRV